MSNTRFVDNKLADANVRRWKVQHTTFDTSTVVTVKTVVISVVIPCSFVSGYILQECGASIFKLEACGFRNQLLCMQVKRRG